MILYHMDGDFRIKGRKLYIYPMPQQAYFVSLQGVERIITLAIDAAASR
jgi:hypothetical protein